MHIYTNNTSTSLCRIGYSVVLWMHGCDYFNDIEPYYMQRYRIVDVLCCTCKVQCHHLTVAGMVLQTKKQ